MKTFARVLSVTTIAFLSIVTITILSFLSGVGPAKVALAEYSGFDVSIEAPFNASPGDEVNIIMKITNNKPLGSGVRAVKVQGEFDNNTTVRGAENPVFATTGEQFFGNVLCPPNLQLCTFSGLYFLDPGESVSISATRIAGNVNVGGELGWDGTPVGHIVGFNKIPVGLAWQNLKIR
jgi:hypothetical protein